MQGASGLPYIPTQASEFARSIDLLLLGLTLVTGFFSVGIAFAVIFFAVKYRRGAKVDRSNPQLYNLPIEIAWTGIPLVIALGLFVWSTAIYLGFKTVPSGAMEVYVVGKQWMWKLQHPEGRWEMNELHIPVNRPVALTLTSEDVIHSFFIPELRVKQDVIPGQYTRMWFNADKPGVYHLFCTQFCGTFHSTMTGTVTVMEPADYERWLSTGNYPQTLAATGERLFHKHGCSGCHGPDAAVRAPRLEGVYNHIIGVQIPQPGIPLEKVQATTMVADQRYIHDAIILPEKEVAAGFRPIMPSYRNRISEEEIFQISAYLRSLAGGDAATSGLYNNRTGPGGPTRSLSQEEYKARIGFTPENMKDLTKGAQQGGPSGPGGGQDTVAPRTAPSGTNERMPR